MKRAGQLLDAIADWDNLRLAAVKALRGKRGQAEARLYVADIDTNLRRLSEQLRANTVCIGRYRQFTIYDPKERRITAPRLEERILHHAILNVCEPCFERWLIPDTYACRRGKGRVACLQRAQQFAARFPFFLKLDIRKYFDSICHETLKDLLQRRFKDRRLLMLLGKIIDSYSVAPGKGLPIGSLTSQHFANFYLGVCDRFVKEYCRIPGYVRYMDDMALWATSTAELRETQQAVTAFLAERLQLNVKPTPFINRTKRGMDFLGCRVFPTHQALNARSRRRFQRKLADLERALCIGWITEAQAQVRGQALVAFTRTLDVKSWRVRRRAIDYSAGKDQGPAPRAPRR
jgi:RNA-directed DNA polymerase